MKACKNNMYRFVSKSLTSWYYLKLIKQLLLSKDRNYNNIDTQFNSIKLGQLFTIVIKIESFNEFNDGNDRETNSSCNILDNNDVLILPRW